MQILLLANVGADASGVILIVAIIIICALLGLATLVAAVLRLVIAINYWSGNRTRSSGGYTGATAAEHMLSLYGLTEVRVKQLGFFGALIYGNHYNPRKKTVYLRRSTYASGSITSVALAVQKAELAREDFADGRKLRARWHLQRLAIFGPVLFIPIVIIGLIVDFILGFTGVPLLISSLFGLAFYLLSFVFSALTIPVEKKATKDAIAALAQTDMLNEREQAVAKKVLNTYVAAYITDFIVATLEIVRVLLQILLSIFRSSSKKK